MCWKYVNIDAFEFESNKKAEVFDSFANVKSWRSKHQVCGMLQGENISWFVSVKPVSQWDWFTVDVLKQDLHMPSQWPPGRDHA